MKKTMKNKIKFKVFIHYEKQTFKKMQFIHLVYKN